MNKYTLPLTTELPCSITENIDFIKALFYSNIFDCFDFGFLYNCCKNIHRNICKVREDT